MGRLNSQANTKGSSSRNDDEGREKDSETENTKYSTNDKGLKSDKFTNKQKERNNRSYKSDPINNKPDFKRCNNKYDRQHYNPETSDYDQDGRSAPKGMQYKEYPKPIDKIDENRKWQDGKLDKLKSKDDRKSVRNDNAQKFTAKHEGRQYTSGKERKPEGRECSHKSFTTNQDSKKGETLSITDGYNDSKNLVKTTTETPYTSSGSIKEKERTGKSYSSKRRERQQQRSEQ